MHKGLKEPHILLASGNPQKLIRNLTGVVDADAIQKIQEEVDNNIRSLFVLGEEHFRFALAISTNEWRQRVSRLYYAAYNIKRAMSLKHDGTFSTDSSDHQKVDNLPDGMPNQATYRTKLKNLRDDRNLADYSHLAQESDLLIAADDAAILVEEFIRDAKVFLKGVGLTV